MPRLRNASMVLIVSTRERPQPIESRHDESVTFADVIESSCETWAIRSGAGHDVVEDAVHTDSVECVVLSVEGLVSSADAGVSDEVSGAGCCTHTRNVS